MDTVTSLGRPTWSSRLSVRAGHLLGHGILLATIVLTQGCQPADRTRPFPSKPIEIVVYTKPGGPIDLTVRQFIEVAERHAPGVTFVPKIKSGAGGIVAMGHVLQKKPDGYTLLGCTKSNIAKVVSSGRRDVDNFDWIGLLLVDPECVIIRRTDPPTSWDALLADARQRPGKQVWVGPAAGGLDHVVAQQMWERLGIDCIWSAYDSGNDALAALRRNEGDAYIGNPAEVAGYPNLQVVAVSSPTRLNHIPQTPTFSERGMKGLDQEFMWRGFAMKKGCPPDAIAFYDDLFRKVTADQSWRDHWEKYGIEVLYYPQDRFEIEVAKDRKTFATYQSSDPPSSRKPWLIALGLSLTALVTSVIIVRRAGTWDLRREVVPLGIICACILLVTQTYNFPDGAGIGPAAFPRVLSAVICWMAAIAIAQHQQTAKSSTGTRRTDLVGRLVITLVAYVIATIFIGYALSTLFFLAFQMWALGERRIRVILAVSVGWLVFAYVVFERILHMPLPPGLLWNYVT